MMPNQLKVYSNDDKSTQSRKCTRQSSASTIKKSEQKPINSDFQNFYLNALYLTLPSLKPIPFTFDIQACYLPQNPIKLIQHPRLKNTATKSDLFQPKHQQ